MSRNRDPQLQVGGNLLHLRSTQEHDILYSPKVGLMLGHHLRRWPNIKPKMTKCIHGSIVLAGKHNLQYYCC